MLSTTAPRVFTIPAAAPFLDTLVAALLDGRLVGLLDPNNPFALSDLTIYLPTRRAARAIRESFLTGLGRPTLLPRIRTLGDIDEDDFSPDGLEGVDLPDAIGAMERQLALCGLVLGWSGALVRAAADLPDEEMLVPASPADAARLAGALGRLIDQVGAGLEAWAGLFADAFPADHAKYWQITLEFLEIATKAWPAHLAERDLIDPGTRRDLLLRAEAARLRARGSVAPVIAAGSTGSVPATAELLAAIATLPNGAVVLPGLDHDLDDESWRAIGPSEREPGGAGHPQYGLKKLLEVIGVRRGDVESLAGMQSAAASRVRFLSEAMRPAATTELWSTRPALTASDKEAALAGVAILEAPHERDEALAIATILRGAAETPSGVAALVTPDRGLARRVAAELRRWAIDVDDSAGRPLGLTQPGILARLVATTGLHGAEAETLLALAKHPQAGFGRDPAAARRAAGALERAILRGPRLRPGLAGLRAALASAAKTRWEDREGSKRRFPSRAAQGLSRQAWSDAADLAGRIETCLATLETLAATPGCVPLAALVAAHEAAFLSIAMPDRSDDDAAEALAEAFAALRTSAPRGPDIAPRDYPALFSTLIEGMNVRRRGADPRIHIWGALEARLQHVDVVVLGGLNEGTWPAQTRLDPLLSRPMRMALDLEPPERRIGLAAHDFAQALGHRQVWLTRADRENNEPRVASRWLQRIVAYAGPDLAASVKARGNAALHWARSLDAIVAPKPAPRPRPSPPPALRPNKLAATEIETLIRDPYAIYARHVLKLRPFEQLAKLPAASERGTLIHDILETFVRDRPSGPFDAAAAEELFGIGCDAFAAFADFPEISALWWPRFERIARWFIKEESDRTDIVERLVENEGGLQVAPDFLLTARADRLDRLQDGRVGIIDYKTGTPPGTDEVLSLSPQLPLEAVMAETGAFADIAPARVESLRYYHVSGRREGGAVCERGTRDRARPGKPAVTLPEAIAMTRARLEALVAEFAAPEAIYLSRKIPKRGRVFVGDYDHLARVAEWNASEEESDE